MIWLLTLGSIIAYIAGLILLVRVAPLMLKRSFDDLFFILIAAGVILGAMLSFGAIGVLYATFNSNAIIRVVDAILLVVLLIVALRTALRSFREDQYAYAKNDRVSRLITGGFCLVVAGGAVYVLILLLKPA